MSRILVVEDDADNRELITRFLNREGHEVLIAPDGYVGVGAAKIHVPDLIIMDLGLPGMDGWEATRLIRSSQETAHIPILALTAHALSDQVNRAMHAGINAYELKPVAYRRLMQKIAELLHL